MRILLGLLAAIAITGCEANPVGAGVRSGEEALGPITVIGDGPCGGATPVGFVTHSGLLIWTCNDGRLIVSPRTRPNEALREIPDVTPMLSYWIETRGGEASLVKFYSSAPGDYVLKVANLMTGELSLHTISPFGIDVIESVEANATAGCLMVVSVDPRQFEHEVRLKSYPRHVRIYPYQPSDFGSLDLRRIQPELEIDLDETVTNGASAIGSSLRCTRTSDGQAVIYASNIKEQQPDAARPFTLTRITKSGSVVVARATANILMMYPRDPHLLGALDVETGTAFRLDPDKEVAEVVPPKPGWRWVTFEPRDLSGIQVRPHSPVSATAPWPEHDGNGVDLALVSGSNDSPETVVGSGQILYDGTVNPDAGAFMVRIEVWNIVKNGLLDKVNGEYVIWTRTD